MESVDGDVARAQAVDGNRKLSGDVSAVDVDDQCGFAWVVEALADADAEESGVLVHEAAHGLLFDGDGGFEVGGS